MVDDTTDYRGVRLLVLAVLVILALTVLATPVAAGDFLFGDGSEDDPYEISTVEQLQAIETEPDAHFILVNDIDASDTMFWNDGAGFDPIGDSAEPFTGTVDGQDYEISGLTINRPSESDVALFGNVENDATIENLSLTDVDVTGETSVGSLGGRMSLGSDGRITDVSVSGDVTASGDTRVGGLAGETDDGTYERLSVSVDVTAQSATHVGGLAGRTVDGTYSEISASGDVTGDTEVGGLVGRTSYTGEFSDVYATGDVTGETDVGGVVGQTSSHETVFARVYSAGEVSGSENVGGFAGSADSLDDWTGVYWDAEVGPDDEYGDGHGVSIINDLTTSQMTGLRAPVYMDEFAFTDVWMPGEDNTSYPTFSRESTFEDGADAIDEHLVGDGDEVHPYQLTTIYEVQSMRENPTAHYILMNDIDASATAENWHFNDGFDPVGDSSDRFTGSFDGQGYEIADLTIDRWDENFIGLFGYAEDATIENVSLVDVDVLGADRVGGLVGQSVGGTYESVAASGTVSTQSHFGGGDYVGGLIGHTGSNSMTLENGSFEGTVEGESRVGGLIGFARAGSGSEEVIANSSADVTVSSGAGRSGGFVGIMLSQDNDVVVRDSVAQGAVEIPPETIHYIGGFIGKTEHHGVVSNVSAAVDVAGSRHVGGLIGHTSDYSTTIEDAHASGDVTGPWDTGGLIGTVETGNGVETIKNVSASGTVDDPDADRTIGGLIGRTAADDDLLVTNASALGDVNAPNAENVGGLVGTTGGEGEFRDVYATGNVTGGDVVGGLIGRTSLSTTFTRVYSGGTVVGDDVVGGFAGSRSTSDDLTAVYWDADVGPSEGYGDGTTDAELTGLTTDQMTGLRAAVYLDGFSFYDVWMPGEDDSSYPDLAWNADFEDGSEMVDALVTGDGDEANPYQLTNIYELQTMAAHRSAHYVLADDIDASVTGDLSEGAGFEPIGDSSDRFTGTFDGQGYEISNLTIDRPGESYVGLFGYVDSTTIENVSLVDVDVTGENRVGGLGGTISVDDRVADVSVSGAVAGTGSERIGGVAGQTNYGTYERLSASVDVSAPDADTVGGLIGQTLNSGTVSDVSADGSVTGKSRVGGLIGHTSTYPTTIEDAHAMGAVEGVFQVGGLVGIAKEDTGGVESIQNVSASASVTERGTPDKRFGGLIGHTESDGGEVVVTNASATGDVDAPSALEVGGLVGATGWHGELRDVGAHGNVTGAERVGGVVGHTSANPTLFEDAHATGNVSGEYRVGGLVGWAREDAGGVERYTNVSASGTVSERGSVDGRFGGLIGQPEPDAGELVVVKASATGDVDAPNADDVGGFVGRTSYEGEFRDVYATGNVSGETDVGGFVGHTSGYATTFTQVYSAGEVTGSSNVGGFAGSQATEDDLTAIYWDADVGPSEGYGDGTTDAEMTGLTTDQMTGLRAPVYMGGFSFDDAWMPGEDDASYPDLAWQSVYEDGAAAIDNRLGGEGDEENPYEITDVYELQAMSQNLTAHYTLVNDVDASVTEDWSNGSGFAPIGDSTESFTGTFDGKGYEIANLTIDRSDESSVGLFGYADSATIEDVSIIDANVTGADRVGSLVGEAEGGTYRSVTASGAVTGAAYVGGVIGESRSESLTVEDGTYEGAVSGEFRVGGLIGVARAGSGSEEVIANSSVDVTVSETGSSPGQLGGFVGRTASSENDVVIRDSVAQGTVDAPNAANVGGFVGLTAFNGVVSNVSASVDVTGNENVGGLVGHTSGYATTIEDAHATGAVEGAYQVGGLIGLARENGGIVETIRNVSASGTVSERGTPSKRFGGLIGLTDSDDGEVLVTNASASGDVDAPNADEVGGVVGTSGFEGEFRDVYATGNVTGGTDVGGFVGHTSGWTTTFTRVYSAGEVSGTDLVGGFAGSQDTEDHLTAVYWDTDVGPSEGYGDGTTDSELTGLTTDEMTGETAQTTMDGLSFGVAWTVTPEYPILTTEAATLSVMITETNAPVTEGDDLVVDALVENDDDASALETISLLVENDPIDDQAVSLDPGENETVTLTWSTAREDRGTNTVRVEGKTESDETSVTVEREASPPPPPSANIEWASTDYVRLGFDDLRNGESLWMAATDFTSVDDAFLSIEDAFDIEEVGVTPASDGDVTVEFETVDGPIPEPEIESMLASDHGVSPLWAVDVALGGVTVDEYQVAFAIDDGALPTGADPAAISLYRYDGDVVTETETDRLESTDGTHRYRGTMTGQSTLLVGSPVPNVSVVNATVGETDGSVVPDEPIPVKATLENTGTETATKTVSVVGAESEASDDGASDGDGTGDVLASKNVTVEPGETKAVTLTATVADPGVFDLFVGSVPAGTVAVVDEAHESALSVTGTVNETTPALTESVSVTVTVENEGDTDVTEAITLLVDGEVMATETVTIADNGAETITFEPTFERNGTYELATNHGPIDTVVVGESTADGDDLDLEEDEVDALEDGNVSDSGDDGDRDGGDSGDGGRDGSDRDDEDRDDSVDDAADETPGFGTAGALLALLVGAVLIAIRNRQQ